MFDPSKAKDKNAQEENKRKNTAKIVAWIKELLPRSIVDASRDAPEYCEIVVREVKCGDPNCSPIDTTIMLLFNNSQRVSAATMLRMSCASEILSTNTAAIRPAGNDETTDGDGGRDKARY